MNGDAVISFVVTTYERPGEAHAAVKSIVDGDLDAPVEVVVIDDGSRPDTVASLEEHLGAVDRVRVVTQPNAGLAAARIRGACEVHGSWLAFLDDDDRLLPGWKALARLIAADGDLGIVSGTARLQRPDGGHIRDDPPRGLGPLYSDVTAQFLAGCFAVHREVYERAGGYLPALSSSHQSELFIRVAAVCAEEGLRAAHTTEAVAAISRRPEPERALSNPGLLFDGTRWVLARHARRFALDSVEQSNWEGVAAVSGSRVGHPLARTYAARSVRHNPTNPRAWARAAMVSTPLRRRWAPPSATQQLAPSQRSPLTQALSYMGSPTAKLCREDDLLFLPWRYRENPEASSDAADSPFWGEQAMETDVRYQDPVYRWAGAVARAQPLRVLDVGCGSGDKLVRRVARHSTAWWGVDQPSAIELASARYPGGNWITGDLSDEATWRSLRELHADLVVCADVIEHVAEPQRLLANLASVAVAGARILLSTPDRAKLEDRDPLGPPHNPRHVREWTADEMRLLIEAAGLEVLRVRHLLPRAYSPTATELRRGVHRALHRRAVPDRRSCMALLCRVGT